MRLEQMPSAFLREIPGPQGPLEALMDVPAGEPRAAAVVAHPHPQFGGTMHTKAVYQSAKALARIGVAGAPLQLPWCRSQRRQLRRGTGEMDDFRAGLAFVEGRYAGLPLWAAGMSFGSWVALSVGAEDPRVTLLLGIAAAVDRYDFAAVKQSDKPKFIIHGEEDELVSIKDVRRFYSELRSPKSSS